MPTLRPSSTVLAPALPDDATTLTMPTAAAAAAAAPTKGDDVDTPSPETLPESWSEVDAAARALRKREFALQFKTRACRTFLTTGSCAYGAKCYFAHGAEDFRTIDDNERDNLFSDAAIRGWLRLRRLAAAAATSSASETASDAPYRREDSQSPPPSSRVDPSVWDSCDEGASSRRASPTTPCCLLAGTSFDSLALPSVASASDDGCGTTTTTRTTPTDYRGVASACVMMCGASASTRAGSRFRFNPYSAYSAKTFV